MCARDVGRSAPPAVPQSEAAQSPSPCAPLPPGGRSINHQKIKEIHSTNNRKAKKRGAGIPVEPPSLKSLPLSGPLHPPMSGSADLLPPGGGGGNCDRINIRKYSIPRKRYDKLYSQTFLKKQPVPGATRAIQGWYDGKSRNARHGSKRGQGTALAQQGTAHGTTHNTAHDQALALALAPGIGTTRYTTRYGLPGGPRERPWVPPDHPWAPPECP